MALEDLQSQYGPTNKKGQRGTGVGVDTLAGEGQGNLGHAANRSKYGTRYTTNRTRSIRQYTT